MNLISFCVLTIANILPVKINTGEYMFCCLKNSFPWHKANSLIISLTTAKILNIGCVFLFQGRLIYSETRRQTGLICPRIKERHGVVGI